MALLLVLGAAEARAVDADIACPASVTSGQSLGVTITLKNWNTTTSVSVNRAMVYLAGNSTSNNVASLGLFGPFYRNGFGTKTVPKATNASTPGTVGFGLNVTSSVPASLAGRMAIAGVEILDSNGQGIAGGSCVVTVN